MKGFGEASSHHRALVLTSLDPHLGQDQAQHLFQQIRIAPKHVKRLVEDQPLVRPIDKDGVQRPIKIAAVGHSNSRYCTNGIDDLARPDGQSCRAQCAREMHQIRQQRPADVRTKRFRA